MSGDRGDDPAQQDHQVSNARGRAVFGGVGGLCETAVRMSGVDGAASALLTARSRVRDLVYATDPVAQRIDELQFTLGEGPCLDAFSRERRQLVPDLQEPGASARWPGFIGAAIAAGAAAIFAIPIAHQGRALGVLELYRTTAGALSIAEYDAAAACAAQAGKTVADGWEHYLAHTQEQSSAADALAMDLTDPDTRHRLYPYPRLHRLRDAGRATRRHT